MSKKEKNMNNVEEKDIKKADNEAADTTTDANAANTDNKDADTVETQGSSDADVKEDAQSFNASDAKGAEETVDINNNKKDQKDAVIEDLNDRLKRQMAEFDNYRKRTDKEKSAMFEMGASDVIKKLLPIVDNFERGLASIPEDAKGSAFANGMEMIYKQLLKNLEDAGVKPIEALGQPFDPNFHNAVMHIEDEKFGENIISQELQKGYMYRDSVVRHSMVQVAN